MAMLFNLAGAILADLIDDLLTYNIPTRVDFRYGSTDIRIVLLSRAL